MNTDFENSLKQFYNPESIRFVSGDDFARNIFKKCCRAAQETFANFDNFEYCGSDHKYSKFIAFSYEDGEPEPVQIFVDRANGYKPTVYYGHDGWLN